MKTTLIALALLVLSFSSITAVSGPTDGDRDKNNDRKLLEELNSITLTLKDFRAPQAPVYCEALEEAQDPADSPFDEFNHILEKYTSSGQSACEADRSLVKKDALLAIDKAITNYLKIPFGKANEAPATSESEFADQVVERWSLIFKELGRRSGFTESQYEQELQSILFQIARDEDLKKHIANGVIPVPIISDQLRGTKASLFSYTALQRYLPLRIVPVTIKNMRIQQLAVNNAHPHNEDEVGILRSSLNFSRHDMVHGYIMGGFTQRLQLYDKDKCNHFESCINSLPGIKSDPGIRKALFFLIHENEEDWVNRSTGDLFGSANLTEFALENTMDRNANYSFRALSGDTPQEKQGICNDLAYYDQIYGGLQYEMEKEEKKPGLSERDSSKIRREIQIAEYFREVMSKRVDLEAEKMKELGGSFGGAWSFRDFISRLKNICRVNHINMKYDKTWRPNHPSADDTVPNRMDPKAEAYFRHPFLRKVAKLKKQGIVEDYHRELALILGGIEKVWNEFKKEGSICDTYIKSIQN